MTIEAEKKITGKKNPLGKLLAAKPHHIKIYNKNKFSEMGILYIVGRGGSGKSTFAKNLGKDLSIDVLEVDLIRRELKLKAKDQDHYNQMLAERVKNETRRYTKGLILEGSSLTNLSNDWLASQCLIVIEKPALLCFFSHVTRQYFSDGYSFTTSVKQATQHFVKYSRKRRKLNGYLKFNEHSKSLSGLKGLYNYYLTKSFSNTKSLVDLKV